MTVDQKFIQAVFNFEVETFKLMLKTETFNEYLLTDIKFSEDIPCPIYWITQCWEIILEHPEEWLEECRETVSANKCRNLEIKKIFEEHFGVEFKPIDFYNTDFPFYRDEREASFEEVCCDDYSRDDLIAKGYRAVDLDLYVAVNKFDYNEAERLLKLGANPACTLSDEYDNCLERIGNECSFLTVGLQGVVLNKEQRNPLDDDAMDLINLVGLAAHENMYSLLSRYDTREW